MYHEYLLQRFSDDGHLEEFAAHTAGLPLMYGICLQKQHLDAAHYPKHLEVRNSHRPYLYSLAGSWGMLLFPRPWQVFLAWLRGHVNKKKSALFVEHVVTNTWLREHPSLWLPLHTRCLHTAYEDNAYEDNSDVLSSSSQTITP